MFCCVDKRPSYQSNLVYYIPPHNTSVHHSNQYIPPDTIMDTIAALLQPYKANIGAVTGLVTSLQMLSACFLLNDIRRRGRTLPADTVVPYVGGLVLSTIGLRAGAAMADDTMIRTNFFGVALHVAYLVFFYWYTPEAQKQSAWARIGAGGAMSAGVLAYAAWEEEELLANRLGMLMFAFIFTLVALPFLGLVCCLFESFSYIIPVVMVDLRVRSARSSGSAASRVCRCR